jgi:hypothetical protein
LSNKPKRDAAQNPSLFFKISSFFYFSYSILGLKMRHFFSKNTHSQPRLFYKIYKILIKFYKKYFTGAESGVFFKK